MSDFDDTNRGVLFKNDKEGNENRPCYTGKINVDGRELRLAAWIKQGQKGKFMSLNVSEFQQQREQTSSQDPFASDGVDDSSIPF